MNPQDDVPAVPLDHQIARANGVTDDQIEQAKKVLTWQHNDPAAIGWPVTLPLELAMGEQTPKEICQSYDISRNASRRWRNCRRSRRRTPMRRRC
jgi:hypothetical protein